MNHILTNDLISQKQYGFMTGRSTTLQLLRAMDDWTEALDKNNEVDIIYLDFKKAFDTVPHQRLFRVLHQLGIGGKTHESKERLDPKLPQSKRAKSDGKRNSFKMGTSTERNTARIGTRTSLVHHLHQLNDRRGSVPTPTVRRRRKALQRDLNSRRSTSPPERPRRTQNMVEDEPP